MISIPIPTSLDRDVQVYLRNLTQAVNRELSDKIGRVTATDQVLLASPSKKIFSVTVDDDGNVAATLVQE